MRGPPGSGKSHLAKKIKDVEYNKFQASVRILSIDDYFTSENDDAEIPQTAVKLFLQKRRLFLTKKNGFCFF